MGALGLTASDLASLIDWSPSYVSQALRGSAVSEEFLRTIAPAVGLSREQARASTPGPAVEWRIEPRLLALREEIEDCDNFNERLREVGLSRRTVEGVIRRPEASMSLATRDGLEAALGVPWQKWARIVLAPRPRAGDGATSAMVGALRRSEAGVSVRLDRGKVRRAMYERGYRSFAELGRESDVRRLSSGLRPGYGLSLRLALRVTHLLGVPLEQLLLPGGGSGLTAEALEAAERELRAWIALRKQREG